MKTKKWLNSKLDELYQLFSCDEYINNVECDVQFNVILQLPSDIYISTH
jgi:hypothetical protein